MPTCSDVSIERLGRLEPFLRSVRAHTKDGSQNATIFGFPSIHFITFTVDW
jgi:hypothetical protein